jgi:arylsulfatase
MVGKWHLGKTETTIPHARGFERSFALMESGADNWVEQSYSPMYTGVHYFEDERQVKLPTENYFSTNFYTDKIIDYIDSGRDDGKPFFAYVAYQAVHYPHQAPREFIDKYDGVYDGGWEELRRERLKRQKELGIVSSDVALATQFTSTTMDSWKIPDWDSLSEEEKRFSAHRMQTYAGMVDNMDVNVGRLLAHLEEMGEAENTLVIFLSDNGADPTQMPLLPGFGPWYEANYSFSQRGDYDAEFSQMGQKGSFDYYGPGWAAAANAPHSYYKTSSSEGGLRVPFVARFPGKIPAGQSSDTFGFVKDIVPTVLEVAGVETPGTSYNGKTIHPPNGTSMWRVLTGEASTVHDASEAIGYELAGSSALFQGQYKLVRNLPPKGTGEWELYDMGADPSEVHDLAQEKPKLVADLIQAYADYEGRNGVVPVPDGYNPEQQAAKNAARGAKH